MIAKESSLPYCYAEEYDSKAFACRNCGFKKPCAKGEKMQKENDLLFL